MFPRASEEERAEVVRRHQAGETFAQIEAATGWSRCFIGRVCHAAGLRRFEIDAAAVERLAGQKLTAKQIAARLGVKRDTVRCLAKRRGIPLVHDVTSGGAGVPRRIKAQRSALGQALQGAANPARPDE